MASSSLRPPAQLRSFHWLRERPALCSFLAICAIDELGLQMLNVAIAWHVYAVTHNPMSLAYVGLARFLPNIGVALIAGQAADRFDKRSIIRLSIFLQTLCMALLGISLRLDRLSLGVVYLLLLIIGAAQAFSFPAVSAIQPQLVDAQEFPRAVALSSSVFQICSLAGPAVGGLIYALSGPGMFAVAAGLYLIALTQVHGLPRVCVLHGATEDSGCTDQTALGGIRYIRSNHLLLSLISLDLFAVLLGGVTALLPIYAKDILALGPTGLGCLRCAPGVGAAIVGMFLAQRTINRGAGKLMLACVAGFGFATIVFAISTNLYLSIAALMVAGGFDMVSMVIRQTLAQIATPDAMRGRVGAVQWVFIGASSELGEFESGITAALFGVMPAAVLGGIGTLAIVALWTKIFPELPSVDRLVT